jgi:hypothetical protein
MQLRCFVVVARPKGRLGRRRWPKPPPHQYAPPHEHSGTRGRALAAMWDLKVTARRPERALEASVDRRRVNDLPNKRLKPSGAARSGPAHRDPAVEQQWNVG